MDLHATLGFPDRTTRRKPNKERYIELMWSMVGKEEEIELPNCLQEPALGKFDGKEEFMMNEDETRVYIYLPEFVSSSHSVMKMQLYYYNRWTRNEVTKIIVKTWDESTLRVDMAMKKSLRERMISDNGLAIRYREANYPGFDYLCEGFDISYGDKEIQSTLVGLGSAAELKNLLFLEAENLNKINRNLLKTLINRETFVKGKNLILRLTVEI